jgi:hypothetical protein
LALCGCSRQWYEASDPAVTTVDLESSFGPFDGAEFLQHFQRPRLPDLAQLLGAAIAALAAAAPSSGEFNEFRVVGALFP